jgi:hypothetical protein
LDQFSADAAKENYLYCNPRPMGTSAMSAGGSWASPTSPPSIHIRMISSSICEVYVKDELNPKDSRMFKGLGLKR